MYRSRSLETFGEHSPIEVFVVSLSSPICSQMSASRFSLHAIALILVIGVLGPVAAQAQEVQVPLDPDSTVYTLDTELRRQLGLFPEVEDFQQAQLYRVGETDYELVIQYREQGQTLRDRRTLTQAEVDDLRRRVAQQMQTTQTRVGVEQPGRTELLTWTTLLGLVEGGLVVGAIGADGSAAASLPLLGGAMGFFGPLFATQNRTVTEASGTLTGYGGLQGYAHAVELAVLFGGEDLDGQAVSGLAAIGGAVEAGIGYALGANQGWSPGMAEMIAYNGTYGNLVGLGVAGVMIGNGDGTDAEARLAAGTSLLGSLAGLYAGHRMGRTGTYTRGDARIYALAGLEAARLASSIVVVSDIDDVRTNASLITGFGLAGLGLGAALVRDRDFSTYEANIVTLGTYAGALMGGGFATLGDTSGDTITVMQAIGSALGFGITYGLFASEAQQRARSSTAGIDLDMQITPSLGGAPGASTPSAGQLEGLAPKVTLRATF